MNKGTKKIFFSGIAGSGVSAIAVFMADRGHAVSGSDRAFDIHPDHPLKKTFESKNITIVPQDGSGLDRSFDLAVFSTAVEADRPEVVKARELGIPVMTRPDCLAEITASFNTIAVSGTSGKSTVSGMLAFLMNRLGLRPNFIGGGRVKQFKSAANPGNSLTGGSDYLIIEACESDGTIVNYRPLHTIILNLTLDHHTVDVTAGMFHTLIQNTKGKVFINADDSNLAVMMRQGTVTFSIEKPADFHAEGISYKSFSTDFTLRDMRFTLSLPGRHNLYNALACIALLSELGISLNDIADVLPEFQGIERRFDIHLNDGKHLVIDDYAHNPHKISSMMETVRRLGPGICYIFQPHGFGPTKLMKKEYIESFVDNLRDSDQLILLPIFYTGGTASKDISSRDLADGIRAGGKSAEVIENRKDVLTRAKKYQTCVIFGARDESLSDFAEEIARAVSTG
ncbi:MAG: Mur ligase family protein [Nitrospirota bacterium]